MGLIERVKKIFTSKKSTSNETSTDELLSDLEKYEMKAESVQDTKVKNSEATSAEENTDTQETTEETVAESTEEDQFEKERLEDEKLLNDSEHLVKNTNVKTGRYEKHVQKQELEKQKRNEANDKKYDNSSDRINANIRNTVTAWGGKLFGLLFLLMVLYSIYYTIAIEFSAHEPRKLTVKKADGISLMTDDSELFKLEISKKLGLFDDKFSELHATYKDDMNNTKNEIITYINEYDEKVSDTLEAIRTSVEKSAEVAGSKDTEKDQKIHKFEMEMKTLTDEINRLKEGGIKVSRTDDKSDETYRVPGQNFLPLPKKIIKKETVELQKETPITKEEKIAVEVKKERILEEKVLNDSEMFTIAIDDSIDYEAMYNEKFSSKEKNNTSLLHIMTGFAEATLITGVSAPTFGEGVKNPKPVLLSLDSTNIIANNDYEDLRDCLLIGTATGNMNSSRAEIMITRLSCSAKDKDGGRHKIELIADPIGWVIGEEGVYGVKGRLVDSAGKLLLRQLTIGFLQGVSIAFSTPSVGYIQPNTSGGSGNQLGAQNIGNSLSTGASQGVGSGLNSLAEYYTRMLEGTYPFISVRAGRKLTILFKGFEDATVSDYVSIDVDSDDGLMGLHDYENDSISVEVEIDYDGF